QWYEYPNSQSSASTFRIERSTISVYERQNNQWETVRHPFAFNRSSSRSVSTARPFCKRSAPTFGLISVRHLSWNRSANHFISVRIFPQEAFDHFISLTLGLKSSSRQVCNLTKQSHLYA
ncbi:hypothetical protein VIGAN_03117600, partial [Vigna angularis var. angularis]